MVKPGYKQTSVGIIPQDWVVSKLGDAFHKLHAGVSVNSEMGTTSEYYVLKTSAIHDGNVDISEIKPVIKADYGRVKCPVAKGSIIISRMNTPDLVGECGYVRAVVSNVYLPDRLWQIYCSDDSEYSFSWLNYLLNTEIFRNAIRSTATGTSNSMKNIAKERLLEIDIPKPQLDEQKRISEVLSDVDSLISFLEKLIAKKKAVKQGAMQELLTGKKRLPGFSGEWLDTCIGKICELISGGTPSTSVAEYWDGDIPWCTPTDITSCPGKYLFVTENRITSLGLRCSSTTMLPKGSLLLCTRATIGEIKIAAVPICTNQGFKALVVNEDVDNEWLYYAVQMLKQEMISLSIGSTFLEISKKALANIRIKVPSKNEQKAIASILSDMDAEINELEQKLAKYRQLKQGMMQQLLTGKIRLIKEV